MTKTHRPSGHPRRGFSLLEIQAAFVVLGFSVAALVPFAVAQLKLVAALEKQLPPNTTYVLMSRDHGLVTVLASGGQPLVQAPTTPSSTTLPSAPNIITNVQATVPASMNMTATVTIEKKVPTP